MTAKKTTKSRKATPSARKPRPKTASARVKAKPPARPKPATKTPAARAPAASAPATRPPRRAIFIDVENTSSETSLFEVIDALKIDRIAQPTELTAVGNWRAVGQQMGRRLAELGAQLVHSAPARGVSDWSDLWVAVAAGCWLGNALPGDLLEIVSNDRAFDAVSDHAAARGVVYRRVQHRRGELVSAKAVETEPARRPRRGRRRRGGERASPPPHAHAPAPARVAKPVEHLGAEPHGASRDQMIALIERLTNGEPGRWLNLDVLERGLKAEGFSRPPGSPRLVTRLRMLKDVEIDSHGRVRVAVGERAQPTEHARGDEPPAVESPASAEPAAPAKRRRRRRGGKGRGNGAPSAAESPSDE